MAVQLVPGAEARRPAHRRRYRQVRSDVLPFVPWGLAPLALLVAVIAFGLGPFAERHVAGAAEHAVSDAMARGGYTWVEVDLSGQFVTLRGQPPSAEAARAAVHAARTATVPTWAGPLPPAFPVWNELSPAPPQWRDWKFRLDGGILTLAGQVPGTDARDAIAAAARVKVVPPRITDVNERLTVVPLGEGETVSSEDLVRVGQRGVQALAACDRGEATFVQGVFALRCELPAAEVARVREVAEAPLPIGTVGEVLLLANEAVASCEKDLARLLDGATIEFSTNSAEVPAESSRLLDAIAQVALGCPGRLRVEGHTDSVGVADYNLKLSQRRADAVRTALLVRGLPEDRLVAEGFGDTRPKVGNASPEGQARNRRIEMRVIRSVE